MASAGQLLRITFPRTPMNKAACSQGCDAGPLFAHRKVQPVQDHASEGTGVRCQEAPGHGARASPPQSQAPRPAWPRSAPSGRCQFVQCRGCIGAEEADRWFSEYLEFPCRLVHKPDDDPRLVDSSFAESWDQSTREQAPAVTYARDLSNVRAWVRLRTQPHPRRTRDRPCR